MADLSEQDYPWGLEADEAEHADRQAEVRAGWKDPDKHHVADPDLKVCTALLTTAYARVPTAIRKIKEAARAKQAALDALQELRDKAWKARQALHEARASVNWLKHPDEGSIPLEMVAEYVGQTPEKIVETVLGSPSGEMARFVQGEADTPCPLCGHEWHQCVDAATKAKTNL